MIFPYFVEPAYPAVNNGSRRTAPRGGNTREMDPDYRAGTRVILAPSALRRWSIRS
jgi:hypothetical protein